MAYYLHKVGYYLACFIFSPLFTLLSVQNSFEWTWAGEESRAIFSGCVHLYIFETYFDRFISLLKLFTLGQNLASKLLKLLNTNTFFFWFFFKENLKISRHALRGKGLSPDPFEVNGIFAIDFSGARTSFSDGKQLHLVFSDGKFVLV